MSTEEVDLLYVKATRELKECQRIVHGMEKELDGLFAPLIEIHQALTHFIPFVAGVDKHRGYGPTGGKVVLDKISVAPSWEKLAEMVAALDTERDKLNALKTQVTNLAP